MLMYESFNEVDDICKKYGLENYTINVDGSVDVNGGVKLYSKFLNKLPLRFNKVNGSFDLACNHIESLEGSPISVGRSVDVRFNKLTSLVGGPKIVDGYFYCISNKLTSFEGCPRSVRGNFLCSSNPVYSVYKLIEKIVAKDYFNLIEFQENWNPIRPNKVIIMDRLNDYLETFGAEPVTSVEGYKCI